MENGEAHGEFSRGNGVDKVGDKVGRQSEFPLFQVWNAECGVWSCTLHASWEVHKADRKCPIRRYLPLLYCVLTPLGVAYL
jgi:hypothetical protein